MMEGLPGYDAWKTRAPEYDAEFPEWEGDVEFHCPVDGCGEDLKFGVTLEGDDEASVHPLVLCRHTEEEVGFITYADLEVEAADQARQERDSGYEPEEEYDHEAYLESLEDDWMDRDDF